MDLSSALGEVANYRAKWQAEKRALDAMIKEAAKDKRSPPNDYWKPEHEARIRLRMAEGVLAALEGK